MSSTISAGTTSGTAIAISGDTSGQLVLQTNGTTTAVTISTGQVVTLAQPLPVASGGSGVTTSTGTGAVVLGTSPTITGAVMSTMASSVITSGTTVASTSGTSIDFTGIPSWVKRITVMYKGVSTNGASDYLVQLGAGSPTTTGYTGSSGITTTGVDARLYTTGFGMYNNNGAATVVNGGMTIVTLGSNVWAAFGVLLQSHAAGAMPNGGSVTLAGTLDRVRFTTVNGTDTFDAGSVNILYE